ncbi:MAG: hypothetical protein JST89_13915 [Cyanobacteria bacterium SZAS-4]|nr:hypothetical protein [Cyanobacteria bacterium SZAS-4]
MTSNTSHSAEDGSQPSSSAISDGRKKVSIDDTHPSSEATADTKGSQPQSTKQGGTMSSTQNTTTNLSESPAPPPVVTTPKDGLLVRTTTMPRWSPEEAKRIIEARPIPHVTYDPAQFEQTAEKSGLSPHLADTEVVQGPASIAELARALNNDPNLIYQFVHDNISYYPIFGVQKGAYGALLDGAGTAFDQSMLMVALLRQSGFTANYVLGQIQLTPAQTTAWLGCRTDGYQNANCASNMLAFGGIPNSYTTNGDGSLNMLTLTHCWVQVDIGGILYQYDPSMKEHTFTNGINLMTASGYSQSDLLTAMQTGATVDPSGDYVQNLNHAALNAKLATYSTNLVNYIKTNLPTATMDDIIGGQQIVPAVIPLNQTALPYEVPGDTPTIWTGDVPSSYKISVTVYAANIPAQVFTSDQICGRRLIADFNSSGLIYLALDGTVLATATQPASSGLVISVAHNAYPNNSNDQFFQAASTGGLIVTGFGTAGRGAAENHRKILEKYIANGGDPDAEPAYGEAGAALWCDYYGNFCRAAAVYNGVWSTSRQITSIIHGSVGVASIINFDLGGYMMSGCYLDNNATWPQPEYAALAIRANGLEALAFQQAFGITGISASTYVPIASAAGYKIFYTTPSNLTSVKSQCTFWNSFALNLVGTDSSYNLLSQHGGLTIETWKGDAWIMSYPGTGGGKLSGNYNGGWAGTIYTGMPLVQKTLKFQRPPKPCTCDDGDERRIFQNPVCIIKPPAPDLYFAPASPFFALPVKRTYSSFDQYVDGPLGQGWTHDFVSNASLNSDGYRGLGEDSPIESAAGIVAALAIMDVAGISNTAYTVVTASAISLIEYWAIGQLCYNTVVINIGDQQIIFYKLADGTYYSKDNAGSLTLSGGLYTYKTPQQVAYNYNAAGNLATIVHPAGVTITLTYTSGKLTSVSNGLGRTLTFTYTGNYLTSVSDGTGRSVSYVIDANKNLTQFTDANGQVSKYVYGGPGLLTQVFLPQNPTVAAATYGYDSLGRLKTSADAYSHTYTFFDAGSRRQVTDPLGNSRLWYVNNDGEPTRFTDELGNTTTYEYDGLGRLFKRTEPEGNSTVWTFDGKNNVLTETRIPKSGSGLANIVKTWTYDSTYNKPHTLLDARSNTWTWNYDPANGNLLSFVKPIVGGQTPQESWTYNSRGQVLLYTDETGIVTQFNYDTLTEKLNSVVVDFGVSPHLNLTTNFGYDAAGFVTSVTDPNNNQATITLDPGKRVTQVTAPAPFNYVTKYGYDLNDNVTSIQRQVTSTPTFQTYTIAYTLSDQVYTVTDPASNVTTKTYDTLDRLSTITDAEGRVSTFFYDAMSRLSSGVDALGDTTNVRTYSNNGFLSSIKDANGNQTQYTRDGFDRLDKTIYADASFEQNQSYDANGNLLTYRTRSGNTIVSTFDVLNRLSTKTPTGQAVVTFGYDLHGRLLSESTPVVAGNPASGSFSFSYDTAGRLKQETTPDSKNTQYQRDSNGNVTVLTYPDGYFVTRIYDQLSRLTDIKLNGSASAAIHLTYDQLSRRNVMTYGNGATATYGFQLNDDLTSLVESFTGSSVTLTYGFNKVHQETNRVVSDANYNWRPSAAGSVAYGAASNVNTYPTVGGVSYAYDGNANLTGDGIWTYTYDTESHLLTANKTGVSASYVYDPSHRQVQKVVGSTKTRYIYSGWQRIADYDGTAGTLQNRYVYGDSLDEPLIQVSSAGVLTYLHADAQGSVIATTDATGTVTNKSKYSPFGENAPVGTTFGYTGQRYDTETGLYYYKNRHYSPVLGRFLQSDPIGYAGGLNVYAYADNDPINSSDALGLDSNGGYLIGGVSQFYGPMYPGPISGQYAPHGDTCCDNSERRKKPDPVDGGPTPDSGGGGGGGGGAPPLLIASGPGKPTDEADWGVSSIRPGNMYDPTSRTGRLIERYLGPGRDFTGPGRYHRLESPTQSPAVARTQETTREIWGKVNRGGMEPTVDAYRGPLPKTARGVEFMTDAVPRPGTGPVFRQWVQGTRGVRGDDTWSKIRVFFFRNGQK